MDYSDQQLRALSQELVKEGYFFYQLSFVWGYTPAIRNRTGTRFYFLVDGNIWPPEQLHRHLVQNWRPNGAAEMLYLKNRLDAHFLIYPKEIPDWDGVDASHILHSADRAVAVGR